MPSIVATAIAMASCYRNVLLACERKIEPTLPSELLRLRIGIAVACLEQRLC